MCALGHLVRLGADRDPAETSPTPTDQTTEMCLADGVELLEEYQQRPTAQSTSAVPLIIQGIGAAGKDGTINDRMRGADPVRVDVHAFKVPSAEDVSHDSLCGYQGHLPGRGGIGIFNRSHDQEVTVVRVYAVPLASQHLANLHVGNHIWEHRLPEINAWERYRTDSGVRMVKVPVHILRDEQRTRRASRIDDVSGT